MSGSSDAKYGLNTIFYGPPGTGKTREAMRAAVEIISGPLGEDRDDRSVMDEYRELCEGGRIRFVTFHQSYGYEEFVEGIRPVMGSGDDSGDIRYEVVDGAFKEFCENCTSCNGNHESDGSFASDGIGRIRDSPTIWKVSLAKDDVEIHTYCLEHGYVRINHSERDDNVYRLKKIMKVGDIVLSCSTESTIDAVGVVIGEYERNDAFTTYKHARKVAWIDGLCGVELDITPYYGKLTPPTIRRCLDFKWEKFKEEIINDHRPRSTEGNFVFIIDEINRGDISRIFGELITLVEPAKRAGMVESMQVTLPYSRKDFSVPDNVYMIGTMNTADRSLVSMDAALRRRFDFIEVMPEPDLLKNTVEGIDLKSLLETVNGRIEALYDREHMLGHSYFMGIENMDSLKNVFKNKVIPLLRDYFHEDYEKIRFVLSEKGNHDKSPFIDENKPNCFDEDYNKENRTYRIVYPDKADSYISIYDDKS